MPQIPNGVPTSKQRPKLVNRGAAGLLTKIAAKDAEPAVVDTRPVPINKIADGLEALIVDIDTLVPDPKNARLHNERNLAAIRESLIYYGQVKPIVVRADTRVVVAGNGTLATAKAMGWTKLAASIVPMTDAEAAGYGIADNRTAELASWDFEVLATLEVLTREAEIPMTGWSFNEIVTLRASGGDWSPAALVDDGTGLSATQQAKPLLVSFNPDQRAAVDTAIAKLREVCHIPDMNDTEALMIICQDWFDALDRYNAPIPF